MTLTRALIAAESGLGAFGLQFRHQRPHAPGIGAEFRRIAVDPSADLRHAFGLL
jgi:hypothetical protein